MLCTFFRMRRFKRKPLRSSQKHSLFVRTEQWSRSCFTRTRRRRPPGTEDMRECVT
jgi:hypothetical protein